MRCVLTGLMLVACAAALCAQTAPAARQSSGLETDWDIAPVLQQIGGHADRLLPLLDRINVKNWVEQGASDTYLNQLQSGKEQARALSDQAKALARNPERLSGSLEIYFRIQALDMILRSLEDGVRRYQGPAEAQKLLSIIVANDGNRDRLQRYIVNLAAQREQELAVMDREAQRCRALVTQAPASTGRKR